MCKGKDQLDKVPNPARGQLTGNIFFDGAKLRGYVQLNTHTHTLGRINASGIE